MCYFAEESLLWLYIMNTGVVMLDRVVPMVWKNGTTLVFITWSMGRVAVTPLPLHWACVLKDDKSKLHA